MLTFRRPRFCCLLLVAVVVAPALGATVFTVTNTNDSGPGSLRQAMLDAAAQGGPHTINCVSVSGRLELLSGLPAVLDDVTISGPGADTLTLTREPFVPIPVSGLSTSPTADSFFSVPAGAELVVSGLRVAHNGFLGWHLMLVDAGATAEFQDCTLERTNGIISSGSITLRDCVVRNNTSNPFLRSMGAPSYVHCQRVLFIDNAPNCEYDNGGITAVAGALAIFGGALIEECQFIRNFSTAHAGAVYLWAGHLTVRDSLFSDNYLGVIPIGVPSPPWAGGAAIYAHTAGEGGLIVERTTFENNRGAARSGAVHLHRCNAFLRDCTFRNNRALRDEGNGGAIFAEGSSVRLHNCTFHGNSAGSVSGRGGAIYYTDYSPASPGLCEIAFCTISGNSAAGGGGGVFLAGQYLVELHSSVVSGNIAPANEDLGRTVGTLGSAGYNFIGNAGTSGFAGLATDQVGSPQSVLMPSLGPLQHNGGPTLTRLPDWGSPLIDAGDLHPGIQEDQRGAGRITNFSGVPNAPGGNGSDIGAVEREEPGTITISASALELAAAAEGTASAPHLVVCEAFGVSTPVDISVPPPFEVSLSAHGVFGPAIVTGPPDATGHVAPTDVFVRYNPASGPEHAELIGLVAGDAEPVNIVLRGRVLSAVPGTIFTTFSIVNVNPQVVKPYMVSGVNLTGPITVTSTPPFYIALHQDDFLQAPTNTVLVTAPPVDGVVLPTTIWLSCISSQPSDLGGTVAHTSPGAPTVTTTLAGAGASQPSSSIVASVSNMSLTSTALNTPSVVQSYLVSGNNLSSPVTISLGPPFEVSLSPTTGFGASVVTPAPTGGILGPVSVYLRYLSSDGLHHGTTVRHESPGVQTAAFFAQGTVLAHAPPAGFISVGASSLIFNTPALNTPSAEQNYTLSGSALLAGVTVSASWPFEVSLAPGSGFASTIVTPPPSAGTLPSTTIYVRYSPTAGVSHQGVIAHYVHGAGRDLVSVSGVVNLSPTILAGSGPLSFQALGWSVPSAEQSYAVSGSGLAAPITVSAAGPFEVSLSPGIGFGPSVNTSMPVSSMVPPTTVYVRYNPGSGLSHTGFLEHVSIGASPVQIALDGTVTPSGPIVLSTPSLSFQVPMVGVPSPEQNYSVSGSTLLDPIVVVAPPAFEVSLTSSSGFGPSVVTTAPVSGVVPATTIYVRYHPQSGAGHTGNVEHDSTGVPTVLLNVDGIIPPAGPISVSVTSLTFTAIAAGVPTQAQGYSVSGSNLVDQIDILAPGPFEVSLSQTGGFGPSVSTAPPTGGGVPSTTIWVRYNPGLGASHAGLLEHDSTNAVPISINLSGDVNQAPLIEVNRVSMSFQAAAPGKVSAEQSYSVHGYNLSDQIVVTTTARFEVSLSAGSGFGPSVSTAAPVGGMVAPTTIYVRYRSQSEGSHTGTLSNKSTGAPSRIVLLEGETQGSAFVSAGSSGCRGAVQKDSTATVLIAAAVLLAARRRRRLSRLE